jgi:hypothetical protein
MAVVIREALEAKAAEETTARVQVDEQKMRLLPKSLGTFDSGHTDTSELASDRSIYKPRSWH